jgi:hypothetical protein
MKKKKKKKKQNKTKQKIKKSKSPASDIQLGSVLNKDKIFTVCRFFGQNGK